MELHKQIKAERERQGLSSWKVSQAIPTNPSHYKKLELGEFSPSLDMMKRICVALNISITILPNGDTKINNNG